MIELEKNLFEINIAFCSFLVHSHVLINQYGCPCKKIFQCQKGIVCAAINDCDSAMRNCIKAIDNSKDMEDDRQKLY